MILFYFINNNNSSKSSINLEKIKVWRNSSRVPTLFCWSTSKWEDTSPNNHPHAPIPTKVLSLCWDMKDNIGCSNLIPAASLAGVIFPLTPSSTKHLLAWSLLVWASTTYITAGSLPAASICFHHHHTTSSLVGTRYSLLRTGIKNSNKSGRKISPLTQSIDRPTVGSTEWTVPFVSSPRLPNPSLLITTCLRGMLYRSTQLYTTSFINLVHLLIYIIYNISINFINFALVQSLK